MLASENGRIAMEFWSDVAEQHPSEKCKKEMEKLRKRGEPEDNCRLAALLITMKEYPDEGYIADIVAMATDKKTGKLDLLQAIEFYKDPMVRSLL